MSQEDKTNTNKGSTKKVKLLKEKRKEAQASSLNQRELLLVYPKNLKEREAKENNMKVMSTANQALNKEDNNLFKDLQFQDKQLVVEPLLTQWKVRAKEKEWE